VLCANHFTPNLKRLALIGCEIDAKRVGIIAEAISQTRSKVPQLDLGGNFIRDEGLHNLLEHMSRVELIGTQVLLLPKN
jgi:hypothetical protein